jgi:hypothetical protein
MIFMGAAFTMYVLWMMTLHDFKATLDGPRPPERLPPLLTALWLDAKGDWEGAHRVAQDVESDDGAWVHAYLHRKEGDASNAGYWYRRAGKPAAQVALAQEWDDLVSALLTSSDRP